MDLWTCGHVYMFGHINAENRDVWTYMDVSMCARVAVSTSETIEGLRCRHYLCSIAPVLCCSMWLYNLCVLQNETLLVMQVKRRNVGII